MTEPKNNYEAFVLALRLAIDAPTEEQAQRAVAMAEDLAPSLSELEFERAKKEAQVNVAISFKEITD